MNSKLVILVFIVVIAIVAYTAHYYSTKQHVSRALENLEFKTKLNFRDNTSIAFSGHTKEIGTPYIAPLTKKQCVAYRFTVMEEDTTGKNTFRTTVLDTTVVSNFIVDNQGDLLLVDINNTGEAHYDLYLEKSKDISSKLANVKTEAIRSILNEHNLQADALLSLKKPIKLTEYALYVEQQVTVGGIVNWQSLEKTLPNYNYSRMATLKGDSAQKLLISNAKNAITNKKG